MEQKQITATYAEAVKAIKEAIRKSLSCSTISKQGSTGSLLCHWRVYFRPKQSCKMGQQCYWHYLRIAATGAAWAKRFFWDQHQTYAYLLRGMVQHVRESSIVSGRFAKQHHSCRRQRTYRNSSIDNGRITAKVYFLNQRSWENSCECSQCVRYITDIR